MTVSKYDTAKGQRWRVRYTTPAGKYTDKRGFANKRSAEFWEAENVVSISRGAYVSPTSGRVLMSTLLDEVVGSAGSLAPTTVATRTSVARKWVAEYWDGWRVDAVTPAAIKDWRNAIRDAGASETTLEKANAVLKSVLERAVDRRLILANPIPPLTLRKVVRRKRFSLTSAEVMELAHHIDSRHRVLIGVLAYTGLRFGEAAGLRAEDVDLARRRLDVRHAVAEVNGHVVEGSPKGGRARSVPIPAFLLDDLASVVGARRPGELLFPAARGGHIHLTTWRRRVFYPALDAVAESRRASGRSAFPQITPHDLRHTAASLAVQAGANVKALQRVMGHSSAALTLDVYADLYESDLDEVSRRMDELVRADALNLGWPSRT